MTANSNARPSAMSDREQRLVREAAVLGYVIGATHGPYRDKIPADSIIVRQVPRDAKHFSDLYPLLALLQNDPYDHARCGTSGGCAAPVADFDPVSCPAESSNDRSVTSDAALSTGGSDASRTSAEDGNDPERQS